MIRTLVQNAATVVLRKLRCHRFLIVRHNSRSSNSVYFTLDNGLAGSIRISDHPNKQLFEHRYNLLTLCHRPYMNPSLYGGHLYFYPLHEIDRMVEDIRANREKKIRALGTHIYDVLMDRNFRSFSNRYRKQKYENRMARF